MIRRLGILVSIVLAVFVTACATKTAFKTPEQILADAKSNIQQVSIQQVKNMIDTKEKVILLDVRDKEEFDEGHLPGAINMSRGKLEFHIHELIPDKTAKVVVY